jgi:hypothetical protein
MMSEITAGPWECNDYGMPYDCARFGEVAFILSKEGESFDANEANARLIAAAPDLLSALKSVSRTILSAGEREYYPEVFAAIAKATTTPARNTSEIGEG